jgi:D-sedoheptulose 7-phosphate isomerase
MKSSIQRLLTRYPQLEVCAADIDRAVEVIAAAFRAGGKLLVCGNGGSAADSEHVVSELMKAFVRPRPVGEEFTAKLEAAADELGRGIGARLEGALPAISLVSQPALNTAVLNDTSGEMIFAQQVYGLGRPGDVLLCISTSGNSRNVINAAVVARAAGVQVVALTGRAGGNLLRFAHVAVRAPADAVAEIQELHLPIYHCLCIELEEQFFPGTR